MTVLSMNAQKLMMFSIPATKIWAKIWNLDLFQLSYALGINDDGGNIEIVAAPFRASVATC